MKIELTTERDGPLSPAERQARRRIRRAQEQAEQAVLDAAAEAERIVAEEEERVRQARAERDRAMDLLVVEVWADVLCHPRYSPPRKVQNLAFEEVRRRLGERMGDDEVVARMRSRFELIVADRRRRRTSGGAGSSSHGKSTPGDTCVTLAISNAVTPVRIADPQRDGHAGPADDGTLGGAVTTFAEARRSSGNAPAFLRSAANSNDGEDDEEGGLADHLAAEAYRAHDPDPNYEQMHFADMGADQYGYIR
ncbi:MULTISPECIES: hypothetical protein [unclassified Aureimonas]|uniref:hypothetical protein n=1 Tax=unclassified Aureimonas TaxID=2615206 RepID=UPI0006F1E107|nr:MULTISPECIES: hypothetical protein [unclassified Aureimonas]KQT61201.1 hypothetical protein ASG62_24150 [Aureimonas sp. Leaf427]KQT62970.1 hypothetical protein ASG54_23095 [Aureimonas sp. Leaf460]